MDEGQIPGPMAIGVIDPLEAVQVRHDERNRALFQGIPVDVSQEVIMKESAIIEPGKLVFEDQAGRVLARILKVFEEVLVLHKNPTNRLTSDGLDRIV